MSKHGVPTSLGLLASAMIEGGSMSIRLRTLVCLGTALLLAACEPTSTTSMTASAQDDVLPATEGSKDFGDYIVYFSAISTDQLTPDVAREYGIVRSKSRALLNVSIHRKVGDGVTEAVTGAVAASAINLNGQLKGITLREIREEQAIYYVGELTVTDGEVLVYTVDVTPGNDPSRFTLRFKKQFFVED
jgi:hypothetical protein